MLFSTNISPCNSYFQEFNIFVCKTIKDKLIKHLCNSHLQKLPIAYGEGSVMRRFILFSDVRYFRSEI